MEERRGEGNDNQELMMFYLYSQVTGAIIFPRALLFVNLMPEAEAYECGSVLTHLSLAAWSL